MCVWHFPQFNYVWIEVWVYPSWCVFILVSRARAHVICEWLNLRLWIHWTFLDCLNVSHSLFRSFFTSSYDGGIVAQNMPHFVVMAHLSTVNNWLLLFGLFSPFVSRPNPPVVFYHRWWRIFLLFTDHLWRQILEFGLVVLYKPMHCTGILLQTLKLLIGILQSDLGQKLFPCTFNWKLVLDMPWLYGAKGV